MSIARIIGCVFPGLLLLSLSTQAVEPERREFTTSDGATISYLEASGS